jgi:hypothetical protein
MQNDDEEHNEDHFDYEDDFQSLGNADFDGNEI